MKGVEKKSFSCYNSFSDKNNSIKMAKYELVFLIPAEASEDEIEKIEEKVKSLISDKDGEVLDVRVDPARREIGEIIDGRNSAKMISANFNLSPENLPILNKELKETNSIMRHIIVLKPKIKPRKEKVERLDKEKKLSDKVELEEIDKKIEEMLNE